MLQHIDVCVEKINGDFLNCHIVLAGDLSELSDKQIVQRTSLMSIVHQPM